MTNAATSPRSACDSCAFREGSITFEREPDNRLRAQIAALGGIPFFCHHGLNWNKPIAVKRGFAFDLDGNHQRLKICEGWRSHVARMISSRTKNRSARRAFAQIALDDITAYRAEDDPKEKAMLLKELRHTCMQLVKAAKVKART